MSFLKGEGQGQLRDLLHLCLSFPIPRVLGASLTSTLPGPAPYSKSCKCSNIKRARKMQTDLLSSCLLSGHQREREKVITDRRAGVPAGRWHRPLTSPQPLLLQGHEHLALSQLHVERRGKRR